MKKFLIITFITIFLYVPNSVYAVEDPRLLPNNKVGIHINDANDLNDAANLVNSQGGDWGYVTFVIRDDQRKTEEWQKTFDTMRKLHLIPIVRIASKTVPQYWEKPDSDQIDDWVSFLNSLTWVTKNRYVVIGNEPNQAKEWGGKVNPEEYSDYLLTMSKALKTASPDFFVIPAGFDASAPNDEGYMDEALYIERMVKKNPNLFENVDGWASHSYPNPGFSGSVIDTGRGSIRTFEWELDLLKRLGVTKNLPVFITETGWTHPPSDTSNKFDPKEFGERFKKAYETAWSSNNVVAVTPFILNYQTPPFDTFSWKKKDGSFYEFYFDLKEMPKVKGEPKQENKGEVQTILLPEVLTVQDTTYGLLYIKNTGQKIWKAGIVETVAVEKGFLEIRPANPLSDIEPGKIGTVLYRDLSTKDKKNVSMQFNPYFDTIGLAPLNPFLLN